MNQFSAVQIPKADSIAIRLTAPNQVKLAGTLTQKDPAGDLAGRCQVGRDKGAQRQREMLAEIATGGVGVALDDFGAGYASLGHLRDYPVDGIKIDRSFVAELGRSDGDTAIVAAIVSLAAALGLDVVAEGVEEVTQARVLRELRCPYAQGFLFGLPGPAMRA